VCRNLWKARIETAMGRFSLEDQPVLADTLEAFSGGPQRAADAGLEGGDEAGDRPAALMQKAPHPVPVGERPIEI
jgi:hypothetical protein